MDLSLNFTKLNQLFLTLVYMYHEAYSDRTEIQATWANERATFDCECDTRAITT